MGQAKGLEEFGPRWFISVGCFRQWSNPANVSVWMAVENVRGCKQRWIIIGQGLGLFLTAQQVWCCGMLCYWISCKDCTLRSFGLLASCCFLLSFQCNVGASNWKIYMFHVTNICIEVFGRFTLQIQASPCNPVFLIPGLEVFLQEPLQTSLSWTLLCGICLIFRPKRQQTVFSDDVCVVNDHTLLTWLMRWAFSDLYLDMLVLS